MSRWHRPGALVCFARVIYEKVVYNFPRRLSLTEAATGTTTVTVTSVLGKLARRARARRLGYVEREVYYYHHCITVTFAVNRGPGGLTPGGPGAAGPGRARGRAPGGPGPGKL